MLAFVVLCSTKQSKCLALIGAHNCIARLQTPKYVIYAAEATSTTSTAAPLIHKKRECLCVFLRHSLNVFCMKQIISASSKPKICKERALELAAQALINPFVSA